MHLCAAISLTCCVAAGVGRGLTFGLSGKQGDMQPGTHSKATEDEEKKKEEEGIGNNEIIMKHTEMIPFANSSKTNKSHKNFARMRISCTLHQQLKRCDKHAHIFGLWHTHSD